MKTLSLIKTPNVKTVVSIVVVNERFPSENFFNLIVSTQKITVKFEAILVTHHLQPTMSMQHLTELLEKSPNLLKITVVLTDLEIDQGPAYRRNIGASLANSENLLFADDDAMIAQDIYPLLNCLGQDFVGVQPLILKLLNHEIIDSAGDFITKSKFGFYNAFSRGAGRSYNSLSRELFDEQTPSLRSAFMILRKEAFFAVGGFDPTFDFNLEDVDLGWRLTLAGYRLLFSPKVEAYHKGSLTTNRALYNYKFFVLGLLNFNVLQIKLKGNSFWPIIFCRFALESSSHEFLSTINKKESILVAANNLVSINKLFFKRFKQALIHRRLLEEKFRYKGKKQLEEMAEGKRFILK